jgi:hypothetical protein
MAPEPYGERFMEFMEEEVFRDSSPDISSDKVEEEL